MSIVGTVLLIFVTLMLVGSFPKWKYNSDWGYFPASGVTILLIVIIILLLTGTI
jgi:hypothetical protein